MGVNTLGLVVPMAPQAWGILWCAIAELCALRKEHGALSCDFFISKAAPMHLMHGTWEWGANVCIYIKLVMSQGMVQNGMQGHP